LKRQIEVTQHRSRLFVLLDQDIIQRSGEFLWLMLIVFGAALAALAGAPMLIRLLLGPPVVFFIPGYALVCALFPSDEGLGILERIALSFAFSFALISIIALGIDNSPWPITLGSIVVSLLIVSGVSSTVAVVRRARVPDQERYAPSLPRPNLPPFAGWRTSTRLTAFLFVICLLLLGGSGAVILASRIGGDPMTEFALYNAELKPEFYQREVTVGETLTHAFEIVNHEGEAVEYSVRIRAGDRELQRYDGIRINSGGHWKQPTQYVVPVAGDDVAIIFELYRTEPTVDTEPYRTLRLFVNVTQPRVGS
jgi:uncharacterized membrane protein